jgi:hypothetical protein
MKFFAILITAFFVLGLKTNAQIVYKKFDSLYAKNIDGKLWFVHSYRGESAGHQNPQTGLYEYKTYRDDSVDIVKCQSGIPITTALSAYQGEENAWFDQGKTYTKLILNKPLGGSGALSYDYKAVYYTKNSGITWIPGQGSSHIAISFSVWFLGLILIISVLNTKFSLKKKKREWGDDYTDSGIKVLMLTGILVLTFILTYTNIYADAVPGIQVWNLYFGDISASSVLAKTILPLVIIGVFEITVYICKLKLKKKFQFKEIEQDADLRFTLGCFLSFMIFFYQLTDSMIIVATWLGIALTTKVIVQYSAKFKQGIKFGKWLEVTW